MKKSITAFIICLLATIHLASGRCPNNEEFRKYCRCSSRIEGVPKEFLVFRYFLTVKCLSLNDTNIDQIVGLLRNKHLDKLTLEQLKIKTLRYKPFNDTNIPALVIKNSSLEFIEKGTIGSIKGLYRLNVLQSNLQIVPDVSNASKLHTLVIKSANISSIGPRDISTSNSLRFLEIVNSKVVQIKENVFSGLKNLLSIDLSANNITELPKNLTYGQSLLTIDLRFNEIKKIEPETFENNKRLYQLLLNNNRFDDLSYSKFFKDSMLRGTIISFQGNKFTCNKSLCWIADIVASNKDKFIQFWGNCKYPGSNKTSPLIYLKPDDLNC